MKKIILLFSVLFIFSSCSDVVNINNTSWVTENENMSITMSFNDNEVTISIKEGDVNINEITGKYSIVNDTIRIGDDNNYDKAIVKGDELLFMENAGITKFKKIKQ